MFVSKPCRGAGARTGAQRGAQSRPKDGQSDPNGPQRVAFGRPGGHFWRESRDSGPLQEPQYLLCFNHIMRVRAGPFSLLNAPWGRSTPAEPSFLDFLRPLGRKGGAQGAQGAPRTSKQPPGGTQKSLKNHLRDLRGSPGVPGGPGGTRQDEKLPKNDEKSSLSPTGTLRKFAVVTPFQSSHFTTIFDYNRWTFTSGGRAALPLA